MGVVKSEIPFFRSVGPPCVTEKPFAPQSLVAKHVAAGHKKRHTIIIVREIVYLNG